MSETQDDNNEFLKKNCKIMISKLENPDDIERMNSWLNAILKCDGSSITRDMYLELLLWALHTDRINVYPFKFLPPVNHEDIDDTYKYAMQMIQMDPEKSNAGEVKTIVSDDLREYFSVQKIQGFGTHCFYGFSDEEPLPSWNLPTNIDSCEQNDLLMESAYWMNTFSKPAEPSNSIGKVSNQIQEEERGTKDENDLTNADEKEEEDKNTKSKDVLSEDGQSEKICSDLCKVEKIIQNLSFGGQKPQNVRSIIEKEDEECKMRKKNKSKYEPDIEKSSSQYQSSSLGKDPSETNNMARTCSTSSKRNFDSLNEGNKNYYNTKDRKNSSSRCDKNNFYRTTKPDNLFQANTLASKQANRYSNNCCSSQTTGYETKASPSTIYSQDSCLQSRDFGVENKIKYWQNFNVNDRNLSKSYFTGVDQPSRTRIKQNEINESNLNFSNINPVANSTFLSPRNRLYRDNFEISNETEECYPLTSIYKQTCAGVNKSQNSPENILKCNQEKSQNIQCNKSSLHNSSNKSDFNAETTDFILNNVDPSIRNSNFTICPKSCSLPLREERKLQFSDIPLKSQKKISKRLEFDPLKPCIRKTKQEMDPCTEFYRSIRKK